MSPVVSVIIPTFNRAPLVGDAIESVLAQSYAGHEVIIVDDGSTDNTAEVLSRFSSRARIVIQRRRGVSAARNLAASYARGRYLAFLDSDDLWLAGKLITQLNFMEKNPNVQICQTQEIWIRNGVRVNPKAKHRKPSGNIFVESLEMCLVSPSAVMLTHDLFEKVGGFDENFPVCEDYDLWLRIARDEPISLIDDALVIKRGGHADQLSRSMWGLDRYRIMALQKLLRSGLGEHQHAAALKVLRRKVAVVAAGARKRGRESEAAAYQRIPAEFAEECHVRGENSQLFDGEKFSSTNRGALAELESR